MKKKKKEQNNIFKNLKLTWRMTKGARRYMIGFTSCSILLSLVGGILPALRGKQMLHLSNSVWERLITVAIAILLFELSINVIRTLAGKFGNLFYRATLKNIQIGLAKETLKLETEEIDNNTSGLFIDRLSGDSSRVADIFWELFDVMADVIINFGILVAVFFVSKIMFVFFFFFFLVLFLINRLCIKYSFEFDMLIR